MNIPVCTNLMTPSRVGNILTLFAKSGDIIYDLDFNSVVIDNVEEKKSQRNCRVLKLCDGTNLPICEVGNHMPFLFFENSKKLDKYEVITIKESTKIDLTKSVIFTLAPSIRSEKDINDHNNEINKILSSTDFFLDGENTAELGVFFKRVNKKTKSSSSFYDIYTGVDLYYEDAQEDKTKERLIFLLRKMGCNVYNSPATNTKDYSCEYKLSVICSDKLKIEKEIANKDKIQQSIPSKQIVSISEQIKMECAKIYVKEEKKLIAFTTSDFNLV